MFADQACSACGYQRCGAKGSKEMTKEDFIKYQLVKQSKCSLNDFKKIDAKWECIDVDKSETVTSHEVVAFMCASFYRLSISPTISSFRHYRLLRVRHCVANALGNVSLFLALSTIRCFP
jgi:uncharacterized Fe-S cluster-containing protein